MVSDMAKKRNGRQDAIREIVRTEDVRTQRVLVDELKRRGFDCTIWQRSGTAARMPFARSCAPRTSARSACSSTSSSAAGSTARRRPYRAIKRRGFDCTQATVSRDIADMGLRKLPEGMYVLAEDLHLQRMVSELVIGVQRTENLVIVKAQPGTALGIAAAIDAAELPDVLGSLAGNDTILVITQTADDGAKFEAMIDKLRSVRK